jgi:hypothetical protein
VNPETKVILDKIAAERARQDRLWGVAQRHADGCTSGEVREFCKLVAFAAQVSEVTGHPAACLEDAMRLWISLGKADGREPRWLPIFAEELAEAINAVDDEHREEELVQAAAVLTRWAETVRWRINRARDLEPKAEAETGKAVA